jgi:transcriptional regulator of acetoin/glycerol metabolism
VDLTQTLDPSDERPAREESACYLVIAFDCTRPLEPAARLLLDTTAVVIGRGARRGWSRGPGDEAMDDDVLRIDVADPWTSTVHAQLYADVASASWILEDGGSKNGTVVNGMPVERALLHDGDLIEVGNTFFVFRSLRHSGPGSDHLAGTPCSSPVLPHTLHPPWATDIATLLRVARSLVPVLLIGETGTGKEILARAVHGASARRGPFVAVNCGAIAQTLVESELFGCAKGAYSGATEDRPGLVRAADGGTLFLDEMAALPESAQVALLRVLQEREVLPVGATRTVPVDLRIVVATHEDLALRVEDGRFRADLYARLHGHRLEVPPLRERKEDLGLLIGELLVRLAGERAAQVTLSRAATRTLFMHDFPFNVRELEQALQAALAVAEGDEIGVSQLPEALRAAAPGTRDSSKPPATSAPPASAARLSERSEALLAERERIVAALEACAGNQTQAARRLRISRATLVNKLALHRLPRPRKTRT